MKKLLSTILLLLSIIFSACKKEDSVVEIENMTINKSWQLLMKTTSLSQGDQFKNGLYVDSLIGTIYTGQINYMDPSSVMVSLDTLFPTESASYSSRVWNVNMNQIIVDTYYDANGSPYNIKQHNYASNLDELIIAFQSGNLKKFIINKLTVDQLHITSIADTIYTPLFNANGIYQDTVFMNLTSDKYFFDIKL